MANRRFSFRTYSEFARKMNANTDAFNAEYDDAALQGRLTAEHSDFLQAQAAYDEWAAKTILGDVIVEQAGGLTFREIIKEGVNAKFNVPEVVIFPQATGPGAPCQNARSAVNALLDAFGRKRYFKLAHHNHERLFDHSLVFVDNVKSVFDPLANKWKNYAWKNRRFENCTPYGAKLGGWLGKHIEIDVMLLAMLSGQPYHVVFFDEMQWNRWQLNVSNNLNKVVAEVNEQMAFQADAASTARRLNQNARGSEPLPIPSTLVVGSVDLIKADSVVTFHVTTSYNKRGWDRPVDPKNAQDMQWVLSSINDPSVELTIAE